MDGPDLDALFGEEDENLSPQAITCVSKEVPCQVSSEIRKKVIRCTLSHFHQNKDSTLFGFELFELIHSQIT